MRWRKDQTSWKLNGDQIERPRVDVESDAHIEANLAVEANMIILDTLELIIQVIIHLSSYGI